MTFENKAAYVSVLNVDRQRELSKRISEVISDNRRLLLDAKFGKSGMVEKC